MRTFTSSILFLITRLTVNRNIILDLWQNTSIILLKKDAEHSFIHRFRHITIIESDLQWVITKIWAKSLSSKCMNEDSLQNNQYARKMSSTEESVLNKQIWLDLQRISGEEGVLFDYDATSCYDRILP